MWYKTFNKTSWQVRLWRGNNLTFKYNDLGLHSLFYLGKLSAFYRSLWGVEPAMRSFNFFMVLGLGGLFNYIYKTNFKEYFNNKKQQKYLKEKE